MKSIITISREFGSGGHSIGEAVAKKLGYRFFDRELVNQVAERSGFSPEFIEESGEYASAKNSLLFAIATANQYTMNGISMLDKLYIEQTKIIEEIAQEGSCVIVGRCADYILREYRDCLHVFIHADMKSRAKRIVERFGEQERPAEKRLNEKDQRRKVYYKNYTGRTWGQAQNYDLCLNSGVLGSERCVELIAAACK
ncbi:MAG: AAA family ATPase [Faecousia sp.]